MKVMTKVTVRLFTSLREVAGTKETAVEGESVRQVLDELVRTYGEKFRNAIFDAETGKIRRYYSVLVNGRNVYLIDGLDTRLQDGDTVSIFPPVGGG